MSDDTIREYHQPNDNAADDRNTDNHATSCNNNNDSNDDDDRVTDYNGSGDNNHHDSYSDDDLECASHTRPGVPQR